METQYLKLVEKVLAEGESRSDRTGVGTLGLFGNHSLEFDMSSGRVPLLTTKKVLWEKALTEMLWIIRGETSTRTLGIAQNIWEPWADSEGELGPVYGKQLRDWDGLDQLRDTHRLLVEEPDTRRALVSMWNYGELPLMALPPCPFAFQFHRRGEDFGVLDLQVFQRSCDLFLGVPFDLFEYGVLLRLMARELDVEPGVLYWTGSDVHIYKNAVGPAQLQTRRFEVDPPFMTISGDAPSMFSDALDVSHFHIVGYEPLGPLTAKVAV